MYFRLNNAEITPIFKNGLKSRVENYGSVIILPNVNSNTSNILCFGQILSDY